VSRAREIVAEVRQRCAADPRIRAALTYGSVAQDLDDAYSDAEFWLFPYDPALDRKLWVTQAIAALMVVENEFGALVGFLGGGMRVEFHLTADIGEVARWPSRGAAVDRMVLLDRDGLLTATLQKLPPRAPIESAELVCGRFANWWTLAVNVIRRGELERCHDALGHVRRELLWMARLRHDATDRWLTPSRLAERDLPAADLAELAGTSSTVDKVKLQAALDAAWRLGERWWRELVPNPPEDFLTQQATLLAALSAEPGLPAHPEPRSG